ncbi:hypothetical protein PHMEG_0009439 [Phytophthora megakarya]|uniref:Uncharacterized protein n=1 Tax=Phytophthora megakarya TaxID=4795 RepID=A0A225WGH8_9STRA|nr:hypothetical protein PHMEG_0009439 [Phytophthora megakarya]
MLEKMYASLESLMAAQMELQTRIKDAEECVYGLQPNLLDAERVEGAKFFFNVLFEIVVNHLRAV